MSPRKLNGIYFWAQVKLQDSSCYSEASFQKHRRSKFHWSENESVPLAKWLWRFSSENGSLWTNVTATMGFNEMVEWILMDQDKEHLQTLIEWLGPQFSFICSDKSPWKAISKVLVDCSKHISVEIGDGPRTRFWHEVWSGPVPFKDRSPKFCFIFCSLTSSICLESSLQDRWEISEMEEYPWGRKFFLNRSGSLEARCQNMESC